MAGILISRFGRSTSACRRLASAIVPSVSCARFGSTSSETQPSLPSPSSQTGRRTSQASRMSSRASARRSPSVVGLGGRQLPDLVVVGVALGDRALEDRGVGGHADDAVARRGPRGRRPGRTCVTGSRSRRSGRARRAASAGSSALLGSGVAPHMKPCPRADRVKRRWSAGRRERARRPGAQRGRPASLAQPGGYGLLVTARLALARRACLAGSDGVRPDGRAKRSGGLPRSDWPSAAAAASEASDIADKPTSPVEACPRLLGKPSGVCRWP